MFRELGDWISNYLIDMGLNPIYVGTIICILFSLSYVKYLKSWDEENELRKSAIILTFGITIMAIIFSIASLLGLGGFES